MDNFDFVYDVPEDIAESGFKIEYEGELISFGVTVLNSVTGGISGIIVVDKGTGKVYRSLLGEYNLTNGQHVYVDLNNKEGLDVKVLVCDGYYSVRVLREERKVWN